MPEFDPNQPFTVEFDSTQPFEVVADDTSTTATSPVKTEKKTKTKKPEFDPNQPFDVHTEEQAPIATNGNLPTANLVQRQGINDLADNERAITPEQAQRVAQFKQDAYELGQRKVPTDEALQIIQQKYGQLDPKSVESFKMQYQPFLTGGTEPINAVPQEQATDQSPLTVTANKKPETAIEAAGHSVYDLLRGVPGGIGNVKRAIDQWGDEALVGLGLEDQQQADALKRQMEDEASLSYYNPNGYSRAIGNMLGEGIALAPLGEIAPFAAEGAAAAPVLDTALQGAAFGGVLSGGHDVANQVLTGALTGGALGGAAGTAGKLIGSVAEKFGVPGTAESLSRMYDERPKIFEKPDESLQTEAVGTDNPKVTAQTYNFNDLGSNVTERRANHLSNIKQEVDRITTDWEHSPDINIIGSTANLTKVQKAEIAAAGANPKNVEAWVDSNGKVNVIAQNIENPERIAAILYHEVLGHIGLKKAFGEGLDNLLNHIHDNNWKVRQEVKRYTRDNPEVYKGADQHIRATEEVLAGMSEAGRVKLNGWEKVKQYVKNYLRDKGYEFRVSATDVKAILAEAHDLATGSKQSVSINGGRFSLRRDGRESKSRTGQKMAEAVRDEQRYTQSWEETFKLAEEKGMTPSKLLRKKSLKATPEEAAAAIHVVDDLVNKSSDVQDRIFKGEPVSDRELEMEGYNLARAVHALQMVEGFKSDIGRTLNIFKALKDVPYEELKNVDLGKLSDPDYVREVSFRLRQFADNPQAQTQILRDIGKNLPEDYLTSLHYSLMLGGIPTQAANVLGQTSNFAVDMFFNKGLVTAVGRPLQLVHELFGTSSLTPVERMHLREYGARWWGIMRSLQDIVAGGGWKDIVKSYNEGHPVGKVNRFSEGSPMIPGISYGQKGLAAIDQFFHAVITNSDFYGTAVRKALREGHSKAKLWDRVDELIHNPTEDMVEHANAYADDLQLTGKAGPLASMLNQFKKPPADPRSLDGYARRVLRFVVQNTMPFTRIASAMFKYGAEWSPLTALSADTRAAFKSGDQIEIQQAIAKSLVGSTAGFYMWQEYSNGNFRVNPDTRQVEVKSGSNWVSLKGLDSIVPMLSAVIGLHDAFKAAKGKDALRAFSEIANGFSTGLANVGFMDQLSSFMSLFAPNNQGRVKSFVQSQATSWEPAIARNLNQSVIDPVVRDTTSKDWTQETVNKLKANLPGLSKELHPKLDKFGQPIQRTGNVTGLFTKTPISTDKVKAELDRLEKTSGSPVLQAMKSDGSEGSFKASQVAGPFVQKQITAMVNSPTWSKLTDEQKIAFIKRATKSTRKTVTKAFNPKLPFEVVNQ